MSVNSLLQLHPQGSDSLQLEPSVCCRICPIIAQPKLHWHLHSPASKLCIPSKTSQRPRHSVQKSLDLENISPVHAKACELRVSHRLEAQSLRTELRLTLEPENLLSPSDPEDLRGSSKACVLVRVLEQEVTLRQQYRQLCHCYQKLAARQDEASSTGTMRRGDKYEQTANALTLTLEEDNFSDIHTYDMDERCLARG